MKRVAAICWLAGMVSLSACTITPISGDTIDYRGTAKAPELNIPPNLVSAGVISPTQSTTQSEFQRQRERNASRAQAVMLPTKAIIREDGVFRYLEVEGNVATVWNQLGEFFRINGLVVEKLDATLGVMQTDWQENFSRQPQSFLRDTFGKVLGKFFSSGQLDKYHAVLETPSPGLVRVHLAHYGIAEEYTTADKSSTRWIMRPSEPLLVLEMLKKLANHLGVKEPEKSSALPKPLAIQATVRDQSIVVPQSLRQSSARVLGSLAQSGWQIESINAQSTTLKALAPHSFHISPLSPADQSSDFVPFEINLTEHQGQTVVNFQPINGGSVSETALLQLTQRLNW